MVIVMTTGNAYGEPAIQLLRLPQVCRVTGLCRSMIYRLEACESFPRRIKIGSRAVGWVEGEVQEWLAKRVAGNRCSSTRPLRSI
jgi:prophage regulatory protein